MCFGLLSIKQGLFPAFPKMEEMTASVGFFILFVHVNPMFINLHGPETFSSQSV